MEQTFPFNARLSVKILRRIWLQDTEEINEPESSSSSSSSSPDNFHIKFHIMYNHYWKSPWESGRSALHLVRVDPPSFKDFTLDPRLLNQTHDAYPLLYRILIELNIEPDGHESLVRKIYSFAHNMANSVNNNTNTMGCNKLVMCVEISLATVYYYDRRMEINRAMTESTEEYARRGNGMIPALGSSIEALEKVKLDERDIGENCMVCLEEFSMESLVTRMPCSHLFHGSCIVTWLEKSNACPLCRFMLS